MATRTAPRSFRAVSTALSTGAVLTLPSLFGLAVPATAADDPGARVLALTNAERAQVGCGALVRDARADRAAQGYAKEMSRSDRLSHNTSDGRDFQDRMRAAGYARPGGENIARGQDTPEEVVEEWMGSPSHRKNIVDCSFTTLGVGHAGADDFWVQEFGR